MAVLATFVHISDLHIGLIHPGTGDSLIPVAPGLLPFDGLFGHRADAFADLQNFVDHLRLTFGSGLLPRVIVSGDLTSFGHRDQFTAADDFLGDMLSIPSGKSWGLREKGWKDLAVLGNHDQWPGRPFPLGSHAQPHVPPLNTKLTAVLPRVVLMRPFPTNGRQVCFIHVDTDRDIGPHSGERLKAWGSFVSQLQDLENPPHPLLTEERARDQIRIMVLHHSPEHMGWRLRIDDPSLKYLDEFLERHHVRVMLTGHCHCVYCDPHVVRKSNGQSYSVLEARCGSTTRRERFPGFRLTPNSLLVHTIEDLPDGRLTWNVAEHAKCPAGGGTGTRFPLRRRFKPWAL